MLQTPGFKQSSFKHATFHGLNIFPYQLVDFQDFTNCIFFFPGILPYPIWLAPGLRPPAARYLSVACSNLEGKLGLVEACHLGGFLVSSHFYLMSEELQSLCHLCSNSCPFAHKVMY